jgi:hypothetical protein
MAEVKPVQRGGQTFNVAQDILSPEVQSMMPQDQFAPPPMLADPNQPPMEPMDRVPADTPSMQPPAPQAPSMDSQLESSLKGIDQTGYGLKSATKNYVAEGNKLAELQFGEMERMSQLQEQAALKQEERNKQLLEATNKFQKDEADVRTELANAELKDPMQSASLGAKIMAVIASAIGGYSAGMTGGRNQAVDMIQAAAAQDLQMQKDKYNRLKDKQAGVANSYGIIKQKFNDEAVADNMAMASKLEGIKAKVAGLTARSNNEGQKLKAAEVISDLDLKIQSLKQTAIGTYASNAQKSQEAQAKQQESMMQRMVNIPTKDAQGNLQPQQFVTNQNLVPKIMEQHAANKNYMSTLEELKRLHAEYGPELFKGSASKQRAMALATDLGVSYKEAKGLGAMDKGTQEILDRIIPSDPTSPWDYGQVQAKLDALEFIGKSGWNSKLEAYGLKPEYETPSRKPMEQAPPKKNTEKPVIGMGSYGV